MSLPQKWSITVFENNKLSLSIIVPCFNEKDNIEPLLEKLKDALMGWTWELIIVDDNSPDGTADYARNIVKTYAYTNARVIQRQNKRGLSSAVLWGVQAAHNEVIVVMDGDLQHDETIIPSMIKEIKQGATLVIGSRFMGRFNDDKIKGLSSRLRMNLSILGNRILRLLLKNELTDPLSGFFAVRRKDFAKVIPKIGGYGYKILFELVFYLKPQKIEEIPFVFQPRIHGDSKLQAVIFFDLACDYLSKIFFSLLSPRFIGFFIVGTLGLLVHFSVFYTMLLMTEFKFAQITATSVAMVSNFSLNNILTYREHKLVGYSFMIGLFVYALASLVGVVANVGVAVYLFNANYVNHFFASMAGIFTDVVWRFNIASNIWNKWLGKNNSH